MIRLTSSGLSVNDHRLILLLSSLTSLFLILLLPPVPTLSTSALVPVSSVGLPPVLTLSPPPLLAPLVLTLSLPPPWRSLYHIPVSPIGQRPSVRHMICPIVGDDGPRGRAPDLQTMVYCLQ
jgi:hypothetical protein